MLFLIGNTDSLELVTGSAATLDVVTSYVDGTNANPPVAQGDTTNTQVAAITTATTTTIVSAPAASEFRKIKAMHVRNKHATQATDVTIQLDRSTTNYEIHKVNLAPGEALEYIEGVGFYELAAAGGVSTGGAASADTTANAADTYVSGSAIDITGKLRVGSFIRWWVTATKTAAGTATPVWQIRTGTAATTSDTSRVSFTGLAQTAAADTGLFLITATFRGIGASCIIQGTYALSAHRLAATGLANQAIDCVQGISSSFDISAAGTKVGLSVNPGASGVWTIEDCNVDLVNAVT